LTDAETEILALVRPEDALVAIIVRKDDEAESPASAGLKANFMAPLVINVAARRGLQKIISKLGCDVTLRAQG
ncbi:MAG: flagellar assembly protein FliW, partial [Zoogloeaceae bacterium]|nr:flagellar assembly protein FliW [Zoogloeaceae bacterium]